MMIEWMNERMNGWMGVKKKSSEKLIENLVCLVRASAQHWRERDFVGDENRRKRRKASNDYFQSAQSKSRGAAASKLVNARAWAFPTSRFRCGSVFMNHSYLSTPEGCYVFIIIERDEKIMQASFFSRLDMFSQFVDFLSELYETDLDLMCSARLPLCLTHFDVF